MGHKTGFARRNWISLAFVAALPIAFLIAISVGSVPIPLGETFAVAARKLLSLFGIAGGCAGVGTGISPVTESIVNLRIPRALLAGLVGAALAVSGAVMQGVFKNPLAEGSTLGISSGAALGAVAFLALGVKLPLLAKLGISFSSMLFALLSLIFILFLTYKIDRNLSVNTIILTGVIFSMFAGSLISFLTTFSGDRLRQIVFWSLGSFSGKGYDDVLTLAPFVVAGILVLMAFSRELDIFSFGEEQAAYIGVNTRRIKTVVFIAVSAMIGVSVSVSGTIAFVGLVIPHIVRRLTGQKFIRLIPSCAAAGAVFLILTDLLSRTIISPSELPIGVVTSFVGSIVFLYIFYSRSGGRRRPAKGGDVR